MAELLHITERSLWEAARASGTYEMSTRGQTLKDVGFIHCSQRHQLTQVAKLFYSDIDPRDLVVLVIDSERITSPVRYEAPDPGARSDDTLSESERFPHIYGPLPVEAVVAEEPWSGEAPA